MSHWYSDNQSNSKISSIVLSSQVFRVYVSWQKLTRIQVHGPKRYASVHVTVCCMCLYSKLVCGLRSIIFQDHFLPYSFKSRSLLSQIENLPIHLILWAKITLRICFSTLWGQKCRWYSVSTLFSYHFWIDSSVYLSCLANALTYLSSS